jgi:hypothetical protein
MPRAPDPKWCVLYRVVVRDDDGSEHDVDVAGKTWHEDRDAAVEMIKKRLPERTVFHDLVGVIAWSPALQEIPVPAIFERYRRAIRIAEYGRLLGQATARLEVAKERRDAARELAAKGAFVVTLDLDHEIEWRTKLVETRQADLDTTIAESLT